MEKQSAHYSQPAVKGVCIDKSIDRGEKIGMSVCVCVKMGICFSAFYFEKNPKQILCFYLLYSKIATFWKKKNPFKYFAAIFQKHNNPHFRSYLRPREHKLETRVFLCVNFVEPPDESRRCQHFVNRADASPLVEVSGGGEEQITRQGNV